ncbi:MAG: hypothetical protein ACREIT_10850 [Tepidisphaeraceae bacterium]
MTASSLENPTIGRVPWSSVAYVIGPLLAWVIFAQLVVPPMIRLAHAGRGPAALRGVMSDRHSRPVEYYLNRWQRAQVPAVVGAGVLGLMWGVARTRRFASVALAPASSQWLAAMRIGTCAVLLVTTLIDDLPGSAGLPVDMRVPMGVTDVLALLPGGADRVLSSYAALAALKWATVAALLAGIAGVASRIVLPLAALGTLLAGGVLRHYSHLYHSELVTWYLLAVLAFTPCADAWSLDAWRRRRRFPDLRPPDRPDAYAWARLLCWTVVGLAYFVCALSKFRNGGLNWSDPTNLRSVIYTDNLNPMSVHFGIGLAMARLPDVVFRFFGISTLLLELAFIAVPFSVLARRWLPAGALLMHVGVFVVQNVLFLDLILLPIVLYWAESRAPGGAPAGVRLRERPPAPRRALPWAALVALVTTVWLYRIEFYPLTSMQMYSGLLDDGTAAYFRVVARHADQTESDAPLNDAFPVLSRLTGRYRYALQSAFQPPRARRCDAYLRAVAEELNATCEPARRIESFEVQRLRWHFRRDDDPARAQIEARRQVVVKQK